MPKKSLIDSVAEERGTKRKEDERRDALRERVETWRKIGWITTPIDKVLKGDLDTAEKELDLYEGAIKKIDELNRQFRVLDTRGFEYEAQAIMNKFNDPRQITALEQEIGLLNNKIIKKRKEDEKKWREYAEIEAKRAAEERRKLELEAKRRADTIIALELERKKKEEEKKRLKAEAKKLKEEQKRAKIEAKKVEQERKKAESETKRKEKEKIMAQLELDAKKLEKEMKKLEFEANMRSQEEKKLSDKKKKEEERVAEIRKEAIQHWEKEHALNATNYITRVDANMRAHKPEYSPWGYYLEDNYWKVELDPKKSEVIGKVTEMLLKEQMRLVCIYDKEFEEQFVSNAKQMLLKEASSAGKSKKFISKCYVCDKLDDKSVASTIESFTHPNCSIYIYSLEKNKLIYNKNDMKTELFSEWFKTKGKPKDMKKILLSIADDEGVFTITDIGEKLNFNKKAREELIKNYESRNMIYRLMGEKEKYAFV